jgi:hypothetical protein
MTTCVVFNEKGEFVNVIVAEPWDWVEEGWRLEVIPEGYTWDGKAIVTWEQFQANLGQNLVTPEVI